MLAVPDGELVAAASSLVRPPYRRERLRSLPLIKRQFSALRTVEHAHDRLRFAYSVKTNPCGDYLAEANACGFFAECISNAELDAAAEAGFPNSVYNGPFPAWRCRRACAIVFSDSLQSLLENARRLSGSLVGVRLRPQHITSRFGVSTADEALFEAMRASGRTRTGVSFHVRPEDYGGRSWRDIVVEVLDTAVRLEQAGISISAFDVGGGHTPEEFDAALSAGDFLWLESEVSTRLPGCTTIFSEPGQEVVTPCEFFVAPIIERRDDAIIVDAGYPDFPQMNSSRHRLLLADPHGTVQKLEPGDIAVEGNTCLEYDRFPMKIALDAAADDRHAIIVCDCGAYDSSMSFSFAKAGERFVA